MNRNNQVSSFQVFGELDKVFAENLKPIQCSTDFIFLFPGQKPISAIFLIEGEIEIFTRKKKVVVSGKNILLLYNEYIYARIARKTVKINTGSLYCWADRTMIDELLSSDVLSSYSTSR